MDGKMTVKSKARKLSIVVWHAKYAESRHRFHRVHYHDARSFIVLNIFHSDRASGWERTVSINSVKSSTIKIDVF